MKLSELVSGQRAVIVHIGGGGSLRRRLTEMGFVRGTEIEVIKNAPLRDPIEYKIMGYEISLRRREAMNIEVDILDEKGNQPASVCHLEYEMNAVNESEYKNTIHTPRYERKNTGSVDLPLIKVALVGNPNSGKTTLFNFISGLNEHTGNYSGVTVGTKMARVEYEGHTIEIVDLPGTYSLSAFSPEERFVRDYIVNEKPDFVINVVDSTNLERNLYLSTQLMEIEQPMIVALNMFDEFRMSGDRLSTSRLGQLLASPVIPTVSKKGQGVAMIFDKIINYRSKPSRRIAYPPEIEEYLGEIIEEVAPLNNTKYPTRYVAIKLIEGSEELVPVSKEQQAKLEKAINKVKGIYNEDTETLMAESRYAFVKGALMETLTKAPNPKANKSIRIDNFLTNKYLGLPIFFAMLWVVFYTTFTLGEYPMQWIESGVEYIKEGVSGMIGAGALHDLLVNGIISGVGSVIVFLPNILILFFFISLMEDTGYMARAAFITDKLMHKIGLHGKSFIPLIIGFGCNVPAIMATRTIENRENRLQTMLITPFMSCSARLPVYILITGTFFQNNAANVLFLTYFAGILLAIGSSLLFKKTLFRGKDTHFVMELPPYRIPTAISTLKHMWNKAGQYLKKMGGIILLAVVIIWALSYYPNQGGKYEGESYLAKIGKAAEPVVRPLGFDWKMGIGLISGVAAKEIVVSSMGVIYNTEGNRADSIQTKINIESTLSEKVLEEVDENGTLGEKLRAEKDSNGNPVWTTAVAISFLTFVLIYFPCIAVVSAIRREAGAWKWALFMVFYTTTLAWIVSFVVYRIALLITG